MRNFSRKIWYYMKARQAFQRRQIQNGFSYLIKLVYISPWRAVILIGESTYKIIIPLRFRKAVMLWYKRIFRIAPSFYQEAIGCGLNCDIREEKVIVSLTSYPKRIRTVYKVINTLLTQTYKPDVIVIWLASEQFPNRENDLPNRLLSLKNYGLSIKWYHDIRSYKKLIPAIKEYPNDILVTVDDDVYYPPDWLEKLIEQHHKYTSCIICNNAHKILFNDDGSIKPYCQWEFNMLNSRPSFDYMQVGVGGVLYPPRSLYLDVLSEKLFMTIAPYADDIWFWAMAVLNGIPIKVVDRRIKKIEPIYEIDNSNALSTLNIMEGNRNDVQLQNLIQHYPILIQKIKS